MKELYDFLKNQGFELHLKNNYYELYGEKRVYECVTGKKFISSILKLVLNLLLYPEFGILSIELKLPFFSIGKSFLTFKGERADLSSIYVNRFFRRKGYGTLLLKSLECVLKQLGVKKVYVAPTKDAERFYSKNGYKKLNTLWVKDLCD
ncbi:MAG TPA: GNAT family N-acetyltransferase [Candidatus Aenigmarchaeota archaeon]|nr:GNAT family N-acetyltransferase [Candidatus Aenigmarchaeota archaeon]